MKAAVRYEYGPPELISIQDIPKPVPADDEVLVKVHATTVNRTDCGILWAKPFVIRFFTGLTRPKDITPGTDFAGEVEAVGKNVTAFKPGDRVWGLNDEGLRSQAEYLCIKADKGIEMVPEGISYHQAAAAAEGAHYAYNFISKVKLNAGQKVLVNGATGAIGSAALQMLKDLGCEVTAVCAGEDKDTILALGADRVIDYKTEDFTNAGEQYHFVFDSVGKSEFGKSKKVLLPGGIYISSELGPRAENLYLPLLTSIAGKKKVIFPVPVNVKHSLAYTRGLMERGKFKPLLDKSYPLDDIADAYRYVNSGMKKGNVILRIAE